MNEQTRPTNYCDINDDDTKNHLRILIDWLVQEVGSAGGDGDAIWYSNFYWVNDILALVQEHNDKQKYKWQISFNEEKGRIFYGKNQEGLLITNNKEDFDNRPSWQQCSVVL
jgi:hypothetical protein